MTPSVGYTLLIILVCAACTQLERFLPFLVFRNRPVPPVVRYLGPILPLAVMTTLVIYCIRGISFESPEAYLPELISVGLTAALHWWRKSAFLSIFAGTACYMILIQIVFR